jgi:hypothetical protein
MTKLTKSEIFVSLAFLLLTLGQLVNFKLYGLSSTSFYLFDVYLLSCGLVSILYLVSNYNHVIITRVTFLFLFFTLIASFSLVSNNVVNTYADLAFQAFYLIRWVSYFTTAVFIGHLIRSRLLSVRYIYKQSILSAVFLVLAGFLQLYLLPDFTVLDPIFGWDPHKGRLASTFFDPPLCRYY